MNAHASFLISPETRSELSKLQDVKLSARRLYETAVALQSIPLYPECDGVRESSKRFYDRAVKEMMEAING